MRALSQIPLMLGSSLVFVCGFASAQGLQPMPLPPQPVERPSVINSTYVITVPVFGATTVHLYEENDKLIKAEKWKEGNISDSVEYTKINYVGFESDSDAPGAQKRIVDIDATDGTYLVITFRSEEEAKAVAAYVLSRAQLPLELIGGAWRVRKVFECPQGFEIGCSTFKELLDHEDEDILGYFYQRTKAYHTYACFSNEANEFFITDYVRFTKAGSFLLEKFHDGQSIDSNLARVDWSSGDFGQIVERTALPNQKPQILGSIDSSSLSYRTSFKNRMNTTTQYALDIRWSTGRYKEDYSGKDDNGKQFDNESSGLCTTLN